MKTRFAAIILLFFVVTIACTKQYTPKPRGYFRIDFPQKVYTEIDSLYLPYSFEVPTYAIIAPDTGKYAEPNWINITVPENKAEIFISYKKVNHNLSKLTEDSRALAYKHSIKADAINERLYINPTNKVYGTVYYIDGNAASPVQFYLTDSTENFLRGAFYIREIPNIDSIRPVIDFITEDIIHLIETTEWKN